MKMGSSPSLEATRRKLSATSVITSFSALSKSTSTQRNADAKQPNHLLHKFDNDSSIACTIISEDLSMLVSGCDDGSINVWSALSTPPELLTTLTGHKVS